MKRKLIPIGLALLAAGIARADFNPIQLTPGSYTVDAVIEKTAPRPNIAYTTATMDGGTNNNSQTYYEAGLDPMRPTSGLPAAGTVITAAGDANRTFRLPARYDAPNAFFLTTSGSSTVTITFPTPVTAASISLLHAVSGGAMTNSYTVNYQGGTSDSGQVDMVDWFNTSDPRLALIALGRSDVGSARLQQYGDNPRLFYTDIPVNSGAAVSSITITASNDRRCAIFGVSTSADGFTFTPATVTGYNRDMIVENTAVISGTLLGKCNVVMDDGGPYLRNNTWYEKGFNKGNTNSGIPTAGSTVVGTNGGIVRSFTMAPSYSQNCVVYLGNYTGYTTGTLTLSSPAAATAISVLTAAGNGPVTYNATIYHNDGSTEVVSTNSPDWFNQANAFYVSNGRFNPYSLALNDVGSGNPRMYAIDLPVTYTTPVTKVEFTWTGGGRAMVFALARQASAGGEFVPAAVTGYTADGVVEASANRFPAPLRTATTASMDGGTNNSGSTWYEQGFNPNAPTSGLPAAGSTISSAALPDHHYQLPASYTANNAIFVDSTFTNANLTLATPATYSALSFLSSCANGSVSNYVIMQYQDGTQETNYYVSQDWFNNTPLAFNANGRFDLDFRTFNTVNANPQNPRLYEAQFSLGNTSSKLTNVVLGYQSGGRMMVFAVSGTAGAVPPILGSVTPASLFLYEGTNVTLTSTLSGGTEPISLQWQKQDGDNWVNVSNGGNISGATSLSLVFTGITVGNAGTYRLSASNAAGPGVSGLSTIRVLSGLQDVTRPGDPIQIIAGSAGGGAEGVTSLINNTVQKFFNSDADGAAPFVGPLGVIVTPSIGNTVISGLRFYTGNDAEGRDPADVTIEGSNNGGTTWTPIVTRSLALPAGRNTQAGTTPIDPLTMNMQEVLFANSASYVTYRVTVNNVKDNANNNSMQLAEMELLGVVAAVPPQITRNLPATITAFAGSQPRLSVDVVGVAPISYQWYRGTQLIAGATGSTYVVPAVQLADSGATFKVRVTDVNGTSESSTATLSVIAAPTQPYPAAVLADKPMGFWRLDEVDNGSGNNGVTARDSISGHNGVYNNVQLGASSYNPTLDPDTAAQFGLLATSDSYVGGISGVNFAAPAGTRVAFSVEAWVNANGNTQTSDAGLVTKGFGGGGEQFNLDTGGGGTTVRGFRFSVRDAAGGSHNANSTNSLAGDTAWHHVVGVCDLNTGKVTLYVDGQPVNTTTISPDGGVLNSVAPVTIGARQPGGAAFSNQFLGIIDDVAVYDFALTPEQILAHYYGAQFGPKVLVEPASINVNEGGTARIHVSAYGAPPVSYEWYDVTAGDPGTKVAGQTTDTLTINNITTAYQGKTYRVKVINPYGTVISPDPYFLGATITIQGGAPSFVTNLPLQSFVYSGRTATLSVALSGTEPMTYTWKSNGVTIVNGGRISGANTATLTIANAQPGDTANYQVFVSNTQGGPVASEITALTVSGIIQFGGGAGWTFNGNASLANNVLTLTTAGSQASSAFMQYPMYVGGFRASFRYQDIGGGGADGMAFVVQNDPRGTAALGGAGGALGYGGIAPSAAMLFNIYNGASLSFNRNGNTGNYVASPLDFANGNPIDIVLDYNGSVLTLTMTDTVLNTTATTNYNVGSIPATVGAQTAYVGITGASGGVSSQQVVSNFAFVPKPAVTAQLAAPGSLLLSWPASVGGYILQQSSTLEAGSWTPVTGTATQVGDDYQTTVNTTGGARFFRMVMP